MERGQVRAVLNDIATIVGVDGAIQRVRLSVMTLAPEQVHVNVGDWVQWRTIPGWGVTELRAISPPADATPTRNVYTVERGQEPGLRRLDLATAFARGKTAPEEQ